MYGCWLCLVFELKSLPFSFPLPLPLPFPSVSTSFCVASSFPFALFEYLCLTFYIHLISVYNLNVSGTLLILSNIQTLSNPQPGCFKAGLISPDHILSEETTNQYTNHGFPIAVRLFSPCCDSFFSCFGTPGYAQLALRIVLS